MVGVITDNIDRNRALDAYGVDAIPSSTGEVLGATGDEGLTRNPLPSINREDFRSQENALATGLANNTLQPEGAFFRDSVTGRIVDPRARGTDVMPQLLDPKDANERFGIEGKLSFDAPVSDTVAEQLNRLKRDELMRESTLSRRQGGIGETLGMLGVGLLTSAADPLNVASAFVPVVGEARYASWLAKAGGIAGRARIRSAVGAAEGAVGTAAVEPFIRLAAKSEQADYDSTDSLLNIALGTVLGGGLHASFGAIGDKITGKFSRAIEDARPETREAALRTAVAQVAEGRPVDVEAVLRNDLMASTALTPTERNINLDNLITDTYRLPINELPNIDAAALGRLTEAERLRVRDRQLEEQLFFLPDSAPEIARANASGETLSRLQEVERRLADESLTPQERKTLSTRRDGLLADTTPEKLKADSAPLAQRRAMEAERANIASRLDEIKSAETSDAVKAILDRPLPAFPARELSARLEAMNQAVTEMRRQKVNESVSRMVHGDRERFFSPEERTLVQAINERVKSIPKEPETVADAETSLKDVIDQLNAIDKDTPLTAEENAYLAEADELVKRAEANGKAAEVGAACMGLRRVL